MELASASTAGVEYLALDTETNGLGGDLCELTEVGAALVGGGEVHESWESLVRVERPLSRGIERFTGITQGMVDAAPPPDEVLPEVAARLEGRVLVAHNARFDVHVLRQAFERAGLDWPRPPVLCTVAMARRFAPLAIRRGLAPLAASLGIEVDEVHRALPDALTCARVFCALFPKLCANAGTVGEAVELLRARRRSADPARRRSKEERPDLSSLPDDPGVYVFRDERGRPLYVGKSVSLRTRARAHFCAPAGWTERAEIVDYRPTNSELGALVLENRLIKRWRPAGNRALKRTDRWVYLRARLDIPYPVLEVAPEPAPGLAINVGPLGGKALAEELADQLESLFMLRRCGRRLKLREHPSLYGQMGRCMSPCLGDLDPNAYRRRLDEAMGLFERPGGGERLLGLIDERLREAVHGRQYERAAGLLRRRERLAWVLDKLEGMLRAAE
ncbi:MAG: exonuclease domain-containing protein, partial [Thermoleophilaceae bacterium]